MTGLDVLVVGAGPAGMAAATSAAESGCRVALVDDNTSIGGQIWRGQKAANAGGVFPQVYSDLARRVEQRNIEFHKGARVVAQPVPGALRIETDDQWLDMRYDRLILATGARERFLPFPGWTLPGVMGAGGLQALVKAGLPMHGKRVVLSGAGPLLLAVAAALCKRGARIAGIFEQAPFVRAARFALRLFAQPGKLVEGLAYRMGTFAVPYRLGSWVTRAHGDNRLRAVTVSLGGSQRELACDYLGCGYHLVPNLELPRLLGCRIEGGYVAVDAMQRTSIETIYCAGELTGIGGLDKALIEGQIAGFAASGKPTAHLYARRDRAMRFAYRLESFCALRSELRDLADPQTFVCRCEDVPRSAFAGMQSWREAKLHTRCGMGPCQGRICGAAAETMFGWQNDSVRPPVTPACVSTLAASIRQTAPGETCAQP